MARVVGDSKRSTSKVNRATAPSTTMIGKRSEQPTPYEMIKAAIWDGTLEPGVQLVEAQLAEWCGVSRTPVREALTRLQHDGLVERNERGLVVRERSPEEILDIYEIRVVLEGMAARLAAERHTRMDGIRITKALERWNASTDGTNPADLVAMNQEFHRATWLASRSQTLIDLLERLTLHLGRYPATTLTAPGRLKTARSEHQEIADAVLAGAANAAAKAATDHFTAAMRIRLEQTEEEIV